MNTLPQSETQLVAGKDSQIFLCGGAACHRWGDYFSLSVDPTDDCTFWHTGEYFSAAGNGNQTNRNWSTRISAFKFPSCTPITPVLGLTKTHVGNFKQGQTGAQYTISVTNNGPGYIHGGVTLTDTLPSGLTATAISGTGWSCTLGTLSCTRGDTLAASSSYPIVTVAVNVAGNAPALVTNSATISGGGASADANATDPTTIDPADIIPGTVQLSVTVPSLSKLQNGSYQANVMIVNHGTGTAVNANLTLAALGAASGSVVPQILGNIAPNGGFVNVTIVYPASAGSSGASVVEKYSGTYNGGTFAATIRAVLP